MFKKDDARRLRAKCKGDCLWVLYATNEHGKASWVIKTFVEEHTCPMVYKNFRVTSSYLADRYLADWRAEQNMSVTVFMERVKRDGLGDISAWALRDGFIRGCKRVIGVDGCFLKTELGGQLLTVVGVDVNNDKQKGLTNAIETLFENSEHRTCVRHLYNNFSVCHKGLALKNCMQPGPLLYHSSHNCGCKREADLNHVKDIRVYLMRRIVARRESCDRWTTAVGPRIQKILDKNGKLARFEWAEYAGNEKFQVRDNAGIVLHAVDLRARTCTCRHWQLSGIACTHVIASVVSRGLNVLEFVDDIYKKDAYMRTYTPSISPITGSDAWPTPGLNPLTPPVYTKRPGRPKKNRRKEPNEVASSSQLKRSSQSKRNANTSQSTSGTTKRSTKKIGANNDIGYNIALWEPFFSVYQGLLSWCVPTGGIWKKIENSLAKIFLKVRDVTRKYF
ncbi:uncharacterized protein LOC111373289 [Olea europaea var. sylvestris]|uniref:uncharacterized protein LOC111373289 n=1 Tax=Olea europaea var. sylvestris TaxID=158386 RepID=UPI000C1D0FE1|nr:uncharacterized protein LOC111373289 [Olea europaea var. sylvestris]